MLYLAHLQMKRKTFERDAHILSSLTVEQLKVAEQQEQANKPITNPAVNLLRSHLHTTSGRIMSTDLGQYRLQPRSGPHPSC